MERNPKLGQPVPLLHTTALRLILCIAVGAIAWRLMGSIGLVIVAPVFGAAFAVPIMRLIAGGMALARTHAMNDLQGRHFMHRGHSLLIDSDEDGQCWLEVNQVRQAGVQLPPNAQLVAHFAPNELRTPTDGAGPRVRADALLRALQGSSAPDSHRFSLWLDRSVIEPARRAHQTRLSRRG